MARIFKPKYPRMRVVHDDQGRPIIERKRLARGPRKGQTAEMPRRVRMLGSDGKPVYEESKKWAIEYTDADGKPVVVMGYRDKVATMQKAAELERNVERQLCGILTIDPRHLQAPIAAHIKAWLADLERCGRSPEYTRKVDARINAMSGALRWTTLSSIKADVVSTWLGNKAREASPRTINHYVEASVAFCNWCVGERRLESNPLATLGKCEKPEPITERRALTPAELDRLVRAVPERRGVVYLVAALTGLRRGELGALQWGDVVLGHERPHIALRAATTKSRRADSVALNAEAVEYLKAWRPTTAAPTDHVFASVPKSSTFKADLVLAGLPVTLDGKKADLHSLRVTHATLLATAGVPIRSAMEQMRHTDIRLTTRVYTDPSLIDTHGAVEALPRITGSSDQRQRAVATGTHGKNILPDIPGAVSRPVPTWPRMAKSDECQSLAHNEENPLFSRGFRAKEEWRRGESNPRPATAPETPLRA